MKNIYFIIIITLFATPLYAQDQWLRSFTDGYNRGLDIRRQEEQIQIMKEQRRILEQQRLMLEQQNQAKNNQLTQQQKRECIKYMDEHVPNWRTIGNDPNFINWLRGPVPYTNYTKRQMLDTYIAQGNATMVAQFFLDYLASK